MYNAHLAQQKQKKLNQILLTKNKKEKWLRRYNTEVKPTLLNHYDARINAFIRKIQEKPTMFNTIKEQPIRESKSFFRFKDPRDFSSLFTFNERTERQINEKIMKKRFGDSELAHQSLASQSKYMPISQYQYRARDKQKQIKRVQTTKQRLYRKLLQERKSKLKTKQKKTLKTQQNDHRSISSYHHLSDDRSDSASAVNDDISLRQTAYAPERQDLQKQAIQYQKMQQIHQKKLHFKKLIDLSQNMQDPKGRKQLRQLLEKCGMKKATYNKMNEQSEVDLLGSKIYK